LSAEALQFTIKCLNKNPKLRPDADQLLNHPWLHDNAVEDELDEEAAEEMAHDLLAFRK